MKVVIRLNERRATWLKGHLEKEHPMTKGKIKLAR